MGTKTHDRATFCKYVTADVAKLILSTKKVRWSSPLLFNDPFDCGYSFDYGFNIRDAKAPFINESIRIVFGKDPVVGDISHPWFSMLSYMRSVNDGSIQEHELRAELAQGFEEGIINSGKVLSQFANQWESFMRDHRVFCITEDHDDILMWSHYSDLHRGAVIQLRCIEELDNAICASTKVVYSDNFPSIIPTVDDYVKKYTGQKKLIEDDLYTRFICTKSSHWSYEKEWRLVWSSDPTNTELFELKNLWPQEIDAIYLGCRMSEKDKEAIIGMIAGDLSHVKVFQGAKDKIRYALNFEQIN